MQCFERSYYGKLIVEELRSSKGSQEKKEDILRNSLKNSWPKPFEDAAVLAMYSVRVSLLKKFANFSDEDFPNFENNFEQLLREICKDKSSFAEIAQYTLEEYLEQFLEFKAAQALRELTPLEIVIGAGRKVKINYQASQPPWIESRLQDFFGLNKTPHILNGKLPLTVHLLAPNYRAVQVTQDLMSFWQNSYPAIRRELSRNYPKHSWPDNPLTASPPLIFKKPKTIPQK